MMIEGLIYNAALLITGSILHSYVFARRIYESRFWLGVNGLLYGVMAVLAMSVPITLAPGVIFDSRSVILSLGGLFGGPVVAIVSSLIGVGYRIYLGGSGVITGVGAVLISAGLGVLYRYVVKEKVTKITALQLFAFGIIVSLFMQVLFLATLPVDIALTAVQTVSLPFLTIFPFATMVIGHFMISQINRIRIEVDLAESRKELRDLTSHLQNVREQERAVFAREIHDDFGQKLAVIKMNLAGLSEHVQMDDDQASAQIVEMNSLLNEILISSQRIFSDLRPGLLDDLGLFPALEWLLQDFERKTGITCQITLPEPEIVLSQDLTTNLYRVIELILAKLSNLKLSDIHLRADADTHQVIFRIEVFGTAIANEKIFNSSDIELLDIRERILKWNGEINMESSGKRSVVIRLFVNKKGPLGESP
jgi:signal transduction histidine kinase